MGKRYRFLAMLLSACMLVQTFGMNALAAEQVDSAMQMENPNIIADLGQTIIDNPSETAQDDNSEMNQEQVISEEKETFTEDDSLPGTIVESQLEVKDAEDETFEEEDSIVDEVTEEDISVEEEEVISIEKIDAVMAKMLNDCFSIDEEGTLQLKANVSKSELPLTVDLTRLTVEEENRNLTRIPAGIFDGESSVVNLTIPSSVSTFDVNAFVDARNLETVIFQQGTIAAELFPTSLFEDCEKLKSISIPEGIQKIDANAFEGCIGLETVKLSSTVTTIERKAFSGCKNLVNINFDTSKLIKIGKNAFENAKLREVVFPSTLKVIENGAFENSIFNLSDVNKTSVDFSNTTGLSIGEKAFSGSKVRSITLGNSMERIGEYAFSNCTYLGVSTSGKTIPLVIGSDNASEGVQIVGNNAFSGCTSLREVQLLASVNKVEAAAFANCTAIYSIVLYQGKDNGSTVMLHYNAFPFNKNIIIKGYDGTVKEWAGNYKNQGIQYESLYTSYAIAQYLYPTGSNAGKIDCPKTAKIGDTITVKATPNEGFILLSLNIDGEESRPVGADGKITIKSSDIKNNIINLSAIFKSTGAKAGNYEVSFDNSEAVWSETNNCLTIPYTYMGTKIRIKNSEKQTIANWAWEFSSTDSKTVSVDSEGNLKALKTTTQGKEVVIRAKLKEGTDSISFKVAVGSAAVFQEITGFSIEESQKDFSFTTETYGDGENVEEMQVLQISKAAVNVAVGNNKTANVEVTVNAKSNVSTEAGLQEVKVDGSYQWTIADSSIASFANSHTGNSKNILQVKGVGTTTITVVSDQKDGNNKQLKKQFILRVVDKTPYVESKTLNLNPSYEGEDACVSFDLIPVAGTKVVGYREADGTLSGEPIVVKPKGNGWQSLAKDFDVNLEKLENGKQTVEISLSNDSAYKNVSSQTLSDLYLQVFVDSASSIPYQVKMPTIVITKNVPKPSAKLSGKINLFYTKDADLQAKVSVTIPELKGYVMDQDIEPHLENLSSAEKDQGFTDNFSVEPIVAGNNNSLSICQKADRIEKNSVTGKPAVTGYLVLKYVGYEAVKIKITVPTENKKPSLKLSATSATTNTYSKNLEYELQLLDSKTKKTIDLTGFHASTHNVKSTGVFAKQERAFVDEDTNCIRLTIDEGVDKTSKASIIVSSNDWSEELTYTFTLKTTTAVPKVKLSSTTIEINKLLENDENANSVTVQADQSNVEVVDMQGFTTTNTKAAALEANKIQLSYEDGHIIASIKDSYQSKEQWPKNGTYSYKVTPYVTYKGNSGSEALKPITVKVKVAQKMPEVKLKSSTFTLNTRFAGESVEVAKTTFSWVNLSNEIDETLDETKLTINGALYSEESPIAVEFTKSGETGKETYSLSVSLNDNAKFLRATTSYTIGGLKIGDVTVKDFILKVKPVSAIPTAKLTAKGSINVLDSDSSIVYTVKLSNFAGNIDLNNMKVIQETAANGSWVTESNAQHFMLDKVLEKGQEVTNKIQLKVNPDNAATVEKRKYTLRLKLMAGDMELGGSEGIQVDVTPSQTIPKITLDKNTLTYYMNTPNYGQNIEIACDGGGILKDIVWAKSMDSTGNSILKEAFYKPALTASSVAGKPPVLQLKIKNPALLKKGSTYTLYFATKWENQFHNVESKVVSVKVVMK